MSPRVGVIIVNWNGKRFLGECLAAVTAQDYGNFEVQFIDNASSDGSVEFVRERFPGVGITVFDRNREFAAANNAGMEKVLAGGAEYVALLNNDTRVDRRWLGGLVAGMEGDPVTGICASKMLRMDDPGIIDSTGHVFVDGILRDRGAGERDRGQYDGLTEVVGGCAGAVLYRGRMLREIGFFDESFAFNYEDAELSWRAHTLGWKARYVPQAVVYHARGGSVPAGSALQRRLSAQGAMNMAEALRRHGRLRQKIRVSAIWLKEACREGCGGARDAAAGDYLKRLAGLWSLRRRVPVIPGKAAR